MYHCSEVESSHQSVCERNAVECSDSSLDSISSSSNTMETGLNKLYVRRARECRTGFLLTLTLISILASPVKGWGNSNSNSNTEVKASIYGNQFAQDWLYDSKSLSIQVDGCVWGNVADSEDAGCLEDESEDGTTNWYMMANCRRPQVAFTVYGSSSSSTSCNSNNVMGSVSHKKRIFRVHCKILLRALTLFLSCSMLRRMDFPTLWTTSRHTMGTITTMMMAPSWSPVKTVATDISVWVVAKMAPLPSITSRINTV
jgi:hypothetical protein